MKRALDSDRRHVVKTIIEPFRIKSVEPIRMTDREERESLLPRRVYTQSHVDYVVEAILNVWDWRAEMGGCRIVEAPPVMRHFTARFEPLEA